MRKNEYHSLEDFTSQYTGVWNPSGNKWLGLDFIFEGVEYRLQTGLMFSTESAVLEDGREVLFGLYKKCFGTDRRFSPNHYTYTLLGRYANMPDLLESRVIAQRPFSAVITDESTELVGQD